MWVCIFKARVAELDEAYYALADELRALAFDQYQCLDFYALHEGDQEVALSYWPSEEALLAWKADPRHQVAQQKAQQWYASYRVEIAQVQRAYGNDIN